MSISISEVGELKRILEMGCGKNKVYPDSIGLDFSPTSGADVIHDLNIYPYPFDDDTFDLVTCVHVLEHLDDVIRTVEEIHRILKPGGILGIEAPHFSSVFAYADPTHKHFFGSRSFDYFLEGTPVRAFDYSKASFTLKHKELLVDGDTALRKAVRKWLNGHLDFYEKHITYIFPRHTLVFELEAVKCEAKQ